MISLLHIKNVGIIEEVTLELEEGFNVLTGETGSGKSLIIDCFGIISGGRFSKEMIRKGENSSLVEVCLWNGEEETIVSREIFWNGRNICKINGRLVTVGELKNYMSDVIDIAEQHENQKIMDESFHIGYLDGFLGERISNKLSQYKELFLKYHNLKMELKAGFGDEKEKQRKLDLLNYQINEIEEAGLKEGEEETLELQRKQMMNLDKIHENLEISENALSNQAIEGMESAIRALEKIENLDEKYGQKLEELRTAYYDIDEISREIYNFKYELDFDSNSQEEVENRLDLIHDLKRKYGNNIKEILEYRDEIQKEIFEINNLEKRNIEIRKELKEIKLGMTELAIDIHRYREEYSKILSEKINQELADLEMGNARFLAQVVQNEEGKFNENGIDQVEFLICTNTGEDFLPLTKIASGGELSRIMLAIKTVLNNVDHVQTLVFDEIDTGISGVAAKSVSEKMKQLAKNHQIFVVSHLAVIAASGSQNYFSYKVVENGKTKTNVKKIKGEELVNEIARISSGDLSKASKEHAKELLKNSEAA
ncbi:MAG: DNA repair protein RecN [Clostridia bacterium]|nr:DNA repair protein RecN [Clostridia bacterium]